MTKEAPALGNVIAPDPKWAAQTREPALEPGLPIVDPHHHLWERPGWRYMLDDLLADTNSGHNVRAYAVRLCAKIPSASVQRFS